MSWLEGDKSNDLWGDGEKKISWDDDSGKDIPEATRFLNLNFNLSRKVIGIILIGISVIAIFASVFPRSLGKEDSSSTPTVSTSSTAAPTVVDLYSQPKLLQSFIDNALASAVTIYCGDSSGSGWAIDLTDDSGSKIDDSYPTEIITNNHVIEGCESSGVTIVPMGTKYEYDALVYSFDQNNDLAVLMTDKFLPPLVTIQPGNDARVGQWVMAVGSPGAGSTTLDGSVTTGAITNLRESFVITDATINPGNSGGPLLNAAGQVIAIVSAKIVDANIESIGLARDVSLICEQLIGCTKKQLLR